MNSAAELAARDDGVAQAAAGYRDRLRGAFASALERAAEHSELAARDRELIRNRAYLLASTTMGIFLTVRIDAADAATLCDAVAAEVGSWRGAPRRADSTATRRGRDAVG